jgi:hypothetical protein
MMAAPTPVYHDPFPFSPDLVAFIPVLSPENSVEVTTSITGWRSLWDRHNKSILFLCIRMPTRWCPDERQPI